MQKTIFNLYKNREVRVFLSSTFKDMMDEREFLVKRVFPELRKKFAKRGVTITEIDLRWGVLEEEAENGKVIDICLSEIDKSRPYFIGILGARYGWIPDKTEYEKHKKIIEDFSWVAQDIESNLSITEMEIQYGVLRNPEMLKRSAFYFRDNKNKNSISFKEDTGSVEEKKLNVLKSKIEDNNDLVNGKFNNVEELGAGITDFLTKIIETDFPVLDKKTKKILPQLNFINTRRKAYIKEEKYFKLITEHLERTSSPIVVTGKTGAGASSLLSNYLVEYAGQNPNDILLYNFSNASDNSSNHIQVLKRFCEELSGKEINLQAEFTENTSKQLKDYFDDLISQKLSQKILIVIDGLDEFDNADNSLLLNWLPYDYDTNAKVIFSCGAGESLERLKKRRYELLYINEPDKKAKEKFINGYLLEFSKKLSANYVNIIVDDDISELPLILKSFLDELRQFGLHEELNDQIEYYVSANGPVEFYERLLQRLENDFDENRKGLIEDIFTLLYASKNGLTETEILAILDIPPLYWSPVYNAIESNILNMNGRLSISHKYLNKAVKKRYITQSEKQKAIRKRIINYFNEYVSESRAFQEVAHQLILLDDKKGLFDFLSDIKTILGFFVNDENRELLLRYWSKLYPGYSPEQVYSPELLLQFLSKNNYDYANRNITISIFGLLFYDLGLYHTSHNYFYAIYKLLKKEAEKNDSFIHTALTRLIHINLKLNKIDQAESYALEAISLHEGNPTNNNRLITVYSNLALIYSAKEQFSKEIELFEKLISVIDKDATKTKKNKLGIMDKLAMAYFHINDIDRSISIYKDIIKTKEELYGIGHSENITSFNNLAYIYSEIGNKKDAFEYYNKSIKISTEIYGEFHQETITILFNLIELNITNGNYELAENQLNKIEEFLNTKKITDDNYGQLLHIKAQLKNEKSEHQKSIDLEKQALKVFSETLGTEQHKTINSMLSLSAYLLDVKNNSEAESTIKKAESILLNKFGEKDIRVAEIYSLYAILYQNMGNANLAEEYAQKSMGFRTDVLGETHKSTHKSIHNYASILISNNKLNEAKKIIEYNLNIIETKYGKDSVLFCSALTLMNKILFEEKAFDTVESNLLQISEFYGKFYGQNHKLTCNSLISLVAIKHKLGFQEQVLSLIPNVNSIAEKIWDESNTSLQNWFFDSAIAYSDFKEYDKALELFTKLHKIQSKYLDQYSAAILLTISKIADTKSLNGDIGGAKKDFEKLYYLILENVSEYNTEIISCIHNYAIFSRDFGDLEKTEKLYQKTLELAKENLGPTNSVTLDYLYYLANFYQKSEATEKAELLYNDYLNKLNSNDEITIKTKLEILKLLVNVITPQKRPDKLEPVMLKQVELSEKLYGVNSVQTFRLMLNLATNYSNKKDDQNSAAVLNRMAKIKPETIQAAGKDYMNAFVDLIKFHENDNSKEQTEKPKNTDWKDKTEQNKELIKQAENKNDKRHVMDLLAENIDLYLANLGAEHINTVYCKRDFANKLIEINQFEYASKILETEVLGVLKNTIGINDIEYTLTLYSLAQAQKGLNKLDDALVSFKKVKDQTTVILEAENPFLYEINKKIADTYFAMYKNEEAFNIYNDLLETVPKNNEFERIYLIYQTGQLFLRIKMYDEAIKNIKEAEVFYETYYKDKNPYSVEIPNLMAYIYWEKEDLDSATKFYTLAVENAKKIYPNNHRLYVNAVRMLAFFLFNNNRFSESLPFHIELLNIYLGAHSDKDQIVVEQKLNLSTIYQNLEMHQEAIKFLSEAIKAEPETLSENSQKMMNNLYNFYSAND